MFSYSTSRSIFSNCIGDFRLFEIKWIRWILLKIHFFLIGAGLILFYSYKSWFKGLYSDDFHFIDTFLTADGVYLILISVFALYFNAVLVKIVEVKELREIISKVVGKIKEKNAHLNELDKMIFTTFEDKSIVDYAELENYSHDVLRPMHRSIYATQLILIYVCISISLLDLVFVKFYPIWASYRFDVILSLNLLVLMCFFVHVTIVYLQHKIRLGILACINEKTIKSELEQYTKDTKSVGDKGELNNYMRDFKKLME